MDDLSMVSVFVTNVLPAAGFVLGISAVWYGACLLIGGPKTPESPPKMTRPFHYQSGHSTHN